MRVFLDTNVLESAFATRGLCADVFRYARAEHDMLTGEVNIIELRRVLRDRLKVSASVISALEELVRDQIVVPKPAEPHSLEIKDPGDRWVLASAVDGKADVLVTGDSDLLEVASRAPIRILNPRGYRELARGKSRRRKGATSLRAGADGSGNVSPTAHSLAVTLGPGSPERRSR